MRHCSKSFRSSLAGRLDDHLEGEEPGEHNRKNGYTTKQLKTDSGTIELDTPRDRNAEFAPQIVRNRETILAESLETKIIALYGRGMRSGTHQPI